MSGVIGFAAVVVLVFVIVIAVIDVAIAIVVVVVATAWHDSGRRSIQRSTPLSETAPATGETRDLDFATLFGWWCKNFVACGGR